MKVSLDKSRIKGRVNTPASKSYTIRGLMCSALARGESSITNALESDDTKAAMSVLSKIGVHIEKTESTWKITGDDFKAPSGDLYCGEQLYAL